MANNCYTTQYYYIQKEVLTEGPSFMLYYQPLNRLYEGIAGSPDSFKTVYEDGVVNNENSVSNEDYTGFEFDVNSAKAIINY